MPPATYGITPSGSQYTGNVSALWRKVQGPLREAANFMFPEFDRLKEFTPAQIDWSFREITHPLDLASGAGVASLTEGGWEAAPSSPTVVDATWTFRHINKRFTVSKQSKMVQQTAKGRAAMLANQMQHQGKKALEAIGEWIADSFYGFSTAVRAKVASITSGAGTATQVIVLKDAHGVVGLGGAGSAPFGSYISTLFRPDEYIAFVRTGALVANSRGLITAVTTAGVTTSIAVTFPAAVTLAADDSVVFANSLENSTLEGTDYNKGLTGFLEAFTSVTLHGVSGTTYPRWNPAMVDTAAGRFTPTTLRRMKQAISNTGGGELTDLHWTYGIENDITLQLQAGVFFTDPKNLSMDANIKIGGVRTSSSVKNPPGYVFGYDRKSVRKLVLLPNDPKAPTWDDGEKIQDRSAYVFPIDWVGDIVYLNRGNLAIATNKQEA